MFSNFQPATKFRWRLWASDDAPVIRPVVPAQPVVADPLARAPPPAFVADGYGGQGCERITPLSGRSNFTLLKSALGMTVLGMAVFGMLMMVKGTPNKIEKK